MANKMGVWNVELSAAILNAAAEQRLAPGLGKFVAKTLRKPGNNEFHWQLADLFDPKMKAGLSISFRAQGTPPRRRGSRPVQGSVSGPVSRIEIARAVFDKLGRPGDEKVKRGAMKEAVGQTARHFGISDKVARDCFSKFKRELANEVFLGKAL